MFKSKQAEYYGAFKEWFLKDPWGREPKSQQEWADTYKIGISTLGRWAKRIKSSQPKDSVNLKKTLDENKGIIVKSLLDIIEHKKSPKAIELALKVLGELVEKKEERVKVEFTPSDYIGQAIKLREELRREWESTGSCPICHFSKILRIQPCLDTESEHTEDN